MSTELLSRVRNHINHLLTGYTVKYYRWSDDDLATEAGKVIMFRMNGTGVGNHQRQLQDVRISVMSSPDDAASADDDMLAILRYLRANYEATDVFNIDPFGNYAGPIWLSNGRALFEMTVRCGVEDH